MQIDLHYYGTAVIAASAGFSPDEARMIAYAAQYVDDAQDDDVLVVNGARFPAVRTAHYGLTMFSARTEANIHLPFHFLPPAQVGQGMGGYRVQANSPLAKRLLAQAAQEPKPSLRLCRLGVALHAYADTWSHQGFSAWLEKGNDVAHIEVREDGSWQPLGLAELGLELLPLMGHFQAGFLPDEPFRVWRYQRPRDEDPGRAITRDNPAIYLEAVDAMYAHLCQAGGGGGGSWPAVRAKIHGLLLEGGPDRKARCRLWIEDFPELFAGEADQYDPNRWRERALRPAAAGSDEEVDPEFGRGNLTEANRWEWNEDPSNSPWVNFHQAALMQRGLAQSMVFFA